MPAREQDREAIRVQVRSWKPEVRQSYGCHEIGSGSSATALASKSIRTAVVSMAMIWLHSSSRRSIAAAQCGWSALMSRSQ